MTPVSSNAVTSNAVANDILTGDLVVDHATDMGSVRALDCAAVAVAGGTSMAVMGPSGCGKSTLLGLLAGLALPTQGTVSIGGQPISALSERERVRFRRRALGMVYQADNLLPHLTVEENVGLQLAICRGDTLPEQRADPGVVLERLGLGLVATRLPDQLSGGQRQRVAVARAIIHRPAVILADEPTGALDAANARIVIELLLDVHREIGATLVIVTHDPEIASHLDRVVSLARLSPTSEQTRAR
jgi:putative ABC transport system ATP-binding protein